SFIKPRRIAVPVCLIVNDTIEPSTTEVSIPPLFIIAFLPVLLGPLFFVHIPPLLDYPNHLARAVALTAGGTDLPAAKIYEPHWGIIPNLGSDVILFVLLRFFSPIAAGRLFLAIVLLTVVCGTVIYARTVFGRWTSWSLVSSVAAYNGSFLLGFVNFNL